MTHSVTVGFRCDASEAIGHGHMMRCLVLADALMAVGHSCLFVMRSPQPSVVAQVVGRGHRLEAVDDECGALAAVRSLGLRVLVIDHYETTEDWGAEAGRGSLCVALDDGGERALSFANLIVIPTPLPSALDGHGGRVLCGPEYALVHEAFRLRRKTPPHTGDSSKLAVALGATDTSGALPIVVGGLKGIGSEVTVIGTGSKRLDSADRVRSVGLVDPNELASILAGSDLIIASCSSLTWEICALGRPAVFLQTAPNQQQIAQWIRSSRVAPMADSPAKIPELAKGLIENPAQLHATASRLGSITDGRGAERVAAAVEALL